MRVFTAVFLTLCVAGEAHALSAGPATAPSAATADAAAPTDFDPFLQPIQSEASDIDTERLTTRRSYLKVHQAAGLTALGLLTAQVVLGQYLLNQKKAGFQDESYDNLRTVHKALGFSTFGAYSVAAGAQLLAPKIDRTGAFDTLTFHKGFAIVHGLGMLVTPILGIHMVDQAEKIATTKDFERVDRLNTAHQVVGYTTFGALAGAAIVLTLQ